MRTNCKRLTRVVALLVCFHLPGFAQPALGDIIGPFSEHESYNPTPFIGTTRQQQVYDYSLFSDPFLIEEIAFRPERSGIFTKDVDIRFTTTDLAPNAIGTSLDDNYTEPLTTALSTTSFSQDVVGGELSLHFVLTTPYLYTPSAGSNLLMDIEVSGGGGPSNFSIGSSPNSLIARAFNSEIGSIGDGTSVVEVRAQFTGTVVPEPSTIALWSIIGLIGGFLAWRRRK